MSKIICNFVPQNVFAYGDCEALEEREEQVKLTLFLCIYIRSLTYWITVFCLKALKKSSFRQKYQQISSKNAKKIKF